MRKLLALCLLALLCACGGGGSDERPSTPAITIAVYGDSTQAAWVVVGQERSPSAPSTVAQSILGLTVTNEGVPSTDAGQLLRGDGVHKPWPDEMSSSKAAIVTINHGINDHRYPLDEYRANLFSLVTIAQSAGKRAVLETPNPITTPDQLGLPDRAEAMRSVAAETGALLCDEYKAITDAGMVVPENYIDGVHPKDNLYEFKGRVLAECLRRVL